ncbi:MAG TPA: amino acid adenylation domain-containing protein, partial [Thermoanaerobaculia bacterium]|nr:amino acid adenylation domain-containing protein [Thermoanaerobaculia bacterium]
MAVCLPRSPEGVTSLLAIWKAGGTYMALDPTHPVDRLAGLLEDAAAPVLITRGPLAEALSGTGIHILDPLDGEDDGDDYGLLPAEAPANTGAFIVYTSGSTGRPKGVEIDQRSLLNFVTHNRRATGMRPSDRVTLSSRVAWDGAVWDIWPTLTAGASLHAPEDEVITAPEALRDWMVAEGITVSFLTTSLAELLVTLPWPEGTALRYLQAGGDALRRRPLPGQPFAFMNHYGPTETTVIVTGVPVIAEGNAQPTIGRPLANVRAWVVDRGFKAFPAGVPGELCIGGVQVARGYLETPDLTAQRFVPDPFAGEPGARMYRTGDLVRFRRDGEIEFLGRIDRQVKLRGNRLELGEIEAALTRHPALRDAAVVVDENGPGGRRLVAFWVGRHDQEAPPPMADEIAAFLRQTLPEYMIPALFVPVDGLPLSPNGKIDRRALTALIPDLSGKTADSAGTPMTQTEELMAQIWCQVLGVEAVAPQDDFFHLGGHSLLTAGVISRIRETFGAELPLQAVFLTPTVAGLAAAVDEALRGEGLSVAPPLRRAPRGDRQPLSFAQEGLWFIWHLDPESAVYNVPLAWHMRGPLDATALEVALETVVARHEVLRTLLVQIEGQPFQVVAPPASGLLPRIDLSGLPDRTREEELARVVRAEAGRPFHLSRGPLLRARLARVADDEHVLLLTFHHAVFDGWSTGILTRELSAFYEAATTGRAALLAELPVQYSD